jgi:hypothetical protein
LIAILIPCLFFSENKCIQLVRYDFLWTHKPPPTNVYLTIKTKEKVRKGYLLSLLTCLIELVTSYILSFHVSFPLSLSFSFGNYIEDTTWERKTPWRTNFDRLLIESNFLIVVMRARERTTWKTSSVCDQLLNLNCKMMVTRTHRSSTILLE